jgi:hypothetical protein
MRVNALMTARTLALDRIRDTQASDAFVALFTFQTAHPPSLKLRRASDQVGHSLGDGRSRSRGAFLRPDFCNFASPTPNRGVGGAPRNVRVQRHPFGLRMTRQARRLRGALRPITRQDARERAYDAGRSPLGAPPWRFWAPGAALPSPSAPAVLQRRAGALRVRAASSSHPGRSAWRAGSLPPEASGYEPPPQDATPRSAFRIVSRTRPQ